MKTRKANNRDQNIFDTLSSSEWFLVECQRIRKLYYDSNKDSLLLKREMEHLTRFIPSNWEASIRKYILDGKLEMPFYTGTNLVFEDNMETGETRLYLEIYKKTSQQDVIELWGKIENYQKRMNELWSPTIPEQNKAVFEIWQEVESRVNRPPVIAREVSAVLYNKHKLILAENTITKIVSNMRKQLHMVKKDSKK